MSEPRAYTADEVADKFLDHVWVMLRFWEQEARAADVSERMQGLAFSILVALDGCAVGLPGFKVVPSPPPEDEAYERDRGKNWYPRDVDISGDLHERFHERRNRHPRSPR